MLPQQYCLRWKYHHSNLQTMFSQLLDRGCFCDVTLACEGQLIRAHRVVLSACSTFFDTVLTNYASERDPIIIMKDVTFADVKCLIEFMYKGEINVEHAHLASLLKTADDLKIKGLAEVSWRDDDDDRPPPPTPATEFHSPTRSIHHDNNNSTYAAHEAHHHHQRNGCGGGGGASSPSIEQEEHNRAESPRAQQTIRMPTLTPIPLASASNGAVGNSVSIGAISSPVDPYLGPKRKRGRPPLDDTYDVFNVRKLAGHYAAHLEQHHQAYLESSRHYSDEHRQHAAASPSPASSAAAAAAYQHHIHQQQSKQQRIRQRQQQHQQQQQLQQQHQQRQHRPSESDETEHEDAQTDPEWITSNLEVNVAESEQTNDNAEGDDVADAGIKENDKAATEAEVVENDITITKVDKRKREGKSPEAPRDKVINERSAKRKHSNEEHHHGDNDTENMVNDLAETREQHTAKSRLTHERERDRDHDHDHDEELATTVPQTVEDIESAQHQALEKSSSPTISASHQKSIVAAVTVVPPPPPPPLHHPHFTKYAPEGYLLNEHGMLMTHDYVHAPTASIPSASAAAAAAATSSGSSGGVNISNGSNDNDFIDIKMEDYDAADLRLTSEEMSQWQDVIKMDDYLAKGRRPQFWEEPFTRRVLDAIKNKRLEMKKAARILGVSYGTLYGRYREVYGCLKHPYSSTTFRPSQSNPLAVQPRFDIVWPSAKRDAALLPGQLEIGKIRPKDLSELWSRPQI